MKTYGYESTTPDLLLIMAAIFMALVTIVLFAVFADAEAMPVREQTPAQKEQAFAACVEDFRNLYHKHGLTEEPFNKCQLIMTGKSVL